MAKNSGVNEWIGNGIKSLVFCVFTMFTFFVNNLNKSIEGLTTQLKVMEIHQIETDKRVAAIEVSREINMSSFQKALQDIQDMKNTLIQNTIRIQGVADFIAKHFDSRR